MADYFQTIKKLQDRRRLLLTEADFRSKKQGEKSNHVVMLYREAADISKQLSEMSEGIEKERQLDFYKTYMHAAEEMTRAMTFEAIRAQEEAKRAQEEAKQAQIRAAEEAKRREEEARLAEQKRIEAQKLEEEMRRLQRQQRQIEEQQKQLEEQRRLLEEKKRLEEEKRRFEEEKKLYTKKEASFNITYVEQNEGCGQDKAAAKNAAKNAYFAKEELPTLSDIAGMLSVKECLLRTVERMKYQKTQQSLGMDAVRSILLYGLPGCGKTFIAEGFAGEMKARFGKQEDENNSYPCIRIGAKDILSQTPGEPERKLHEIFELAEQSAPCTVLIDELDSVCVNRESDEVPGWMKTLTASFLMEYDKLCKSKKQVVFIATTNYPDRLDSALLSRMEIIGIGLPDLPAREELFERAISKMQAKVTVSAHEMAKQTPGADCREINRVMENCKALLFAGLRAQFPGDEAAMHALLEGKIVVDSGLFTKALANTRILSKDSQIARLEEWENRMGITGREAMNRQTTSPRWERIGYYWFVTGLDLVYGNDRPGMLEDGRENPFNPTPKRDTEIIFHYFEPSFDKKHDMPKEARKRLEEVLLSETSEKQEECRTKCRLIWQPDDIHYKNRFVGFGNSDFLSAYDSFNTKQQGDAVAGFRGTCGIVASANMVNQQTNARITEAEAVNEFVAKKLCVSDREDPGDNGGTSTFHRKVYLEDKGCQFNYLYYFAGRKRSTLPQEEEITLDDMYRHFSSGESMLLAIDAYDMDPYHTLSKLEQFRKAAQLENANHAVSVAGFTVDENNHACGVWINDTGGFPTFLQDDIAYRTNRFYISEDMFDMMRTTTDGFCVEYVKNIRR